MKKRKFIVLIMVVFSLSLGGCSFFNGQSAKKQEMIQIAESKQMKVAIEKYLKKAKYLSLTENDYRAVMMIKEYIKDDKKINNNFIKICNEILNSERTVNNIKELMKKGYFSKDVLVTKRIKLEDIVNEGFEALVKEKSQVKILVSPK